MKVLWISKFNHSSQVSLYLENEVKLYKNDLQKWSFKCQATFIATYKSTFSFCCSLYSENELSYTRMICKTDHLNAKLSSPQHTRAALFIIVFQYG